MPEPHDLRQHAKALLSLPRKKSKKGELIARNTGCDERSEKCRRTGDGDNVDSRIDCRGNKSRTGIGKQRSSRISDERNRVSIHETLDEPRRFARFVVLVIRGAPRANLIMIEQSSRVPCILCNDKRGRG